MRKARCAAHSNTLVAALLLSREHGFGRVEVANRSMVGICRIYLNEPRQARDDASAAVRAAALVGQPRAELIAETLDTECCYELGEYDAAKVHLERVTRLSRQLGARRFEAHGLEMQARILLDTGRAAEAAQMLREALAMCRDVGMQFTGPKAHSALSRAVDDKAEQDRLLAEGEELLRRGSVGHNHLWFYRDAIEAMLAAADAPRALRYADMLEAYTRSEKLPWSELFVARGRALVRARQDDADDDARRDLERIRAALVDAGLRAFMAPVDAMMAR
jgi:tetratricopeptide (TPR) repeat protein